MNLSVTKSTESAQKIKYDENCSELGTMKMSFLGVERENGLTRFGEEKERRDVEKSGGWWWNFRKYLQTCLYVLILILGEGEMKYNNKYRILRNICILVYTIVMRIWVSYII